MFRRLIIAILLATVLPTVALAYTNPGAPTGFINDFANLLTTEQRTILENKLNNFKTQTGAEISIVTINNLTGDTIENFTVELFKEWGIGQKGKDNGALLLISKDDRAVRIEVGYGLEGDLTDAASNQIIQNFIIPEFKQGNYFSGINQAADKIIGVLQGDASIDYNNAPRTRESNFNWFYFVFFGIMWLGSILGRSKSWWAGGVAGGVIGVIIGLIKGFMYFGIISLAVLIPLGLLFDFIVSKNYQKRKTAGGHFPWWIGGGGFGGGGHSDGGFGGFGGGFSGGGGSSGRW